MCSPTVIAPHLAARLVQLERVMDRLQAVIHLMNAAKTPYRAAKAP
jgi:hypothetical protein